MTTQLVSTNTLTFTSGVAAALQARMAVPPLPLDFLSMLGLGVTSDVTATSDTAATRTITLFAAPATTAVLTPVLVPGDGDGAPIQKVTVGTPGGSYVVPPVLTAVQGAGGPTVVRAAKLLPQLGVGSVLVSDGGSGYSFNTTLTASGGGLAYGGTQATFTVSILDGGINSISVVTPGGPYTDLNQLVLTLGNTGGGTGAVLTPSFEIASVKVQDGGRGYYPGATITVTPYFQTVCPDSAGSAAQESTIAGFMVGALELATNASIQTATTSS